MTETLINKYRPQSFSDVIGQADVCRSITVAIKKRRGASFLLSGPSGVGKTTLARIIANSVGCQSVSDLMEIDGASATGIDAMREVTSHLKFKNIGGGARAVLVDECHAISAQAFKSILKNIEEPPEGVYWILCTTEYAKVPKEIKTRCLDYKLKPVARDLIYHIIQDIARQEKMPIKSSSEALSTIAEMAEGSPRQAISMLAQCSSLKDPEDVEKLCSGQASNQQAIDLCRLLMKNTSWKEVTSCIDKIEGSPEGVRLVVLAYMSSVAKNKPKPLRELQIMEEFSQPFVDREKKAPLYMACGRVIFGG